MTERVAILGLGQRGARWAETCLAAGWDVSGFDPDDRAGLSIRGGPAWQRALTISGAVQGATWVICCLPERLELMRTVVQRAQASARMDAIIAVVSADHNIDAVQGCALRPSHVVRLDDDLDGTLALYVSYLNGENERQQTKEALAVLSAALSVVPAPEPDAVDVSKSRNA